MNLLSAAAVVLLVSVSAAAPAPPSEHFKLDKARIDRALEDMIADGRAVGTSALIWKDGKEVYLGTAGYADREAKRPMRRDTLTQIWSMTKPVTGVALMQLWEQGKCTATPISGRRATERPSLKIQQQTPYLARGGPPSHQCGASAEP